MSKLIEEYACEVSKENLKNLFNNGGSLALAIATFQNLTEEVICKIYDEVVGERGITENEDDLIMIVEFDAIKAEENGVKVELLYEHLNRCVVRKELVVLRNGVYTGKGDESDLFRFMVIAGALSSTDWFVKYLKKWLWYEESDEAEDLMRTFELY